MIPSEVGIFFKPQSNTFLKLVALNRTVFRNTILILYLLTSHYANAYYIKGKVINEKNEDIPGANVILCSTTTGTVTDAYGRFAIEWNKKDTCTIVLTSVGYKTYSLKMNIDTIKQPLLICLQPSNINVDEVKVHSNRKTKRIKEESYSIQLIEEEFLKEAKASSLMGTLKKIPGVNAMDIGSGISKPMIRGMGFYRVVIAQNGIKQEGQKWSSHHGVNIDQQGVSHVEVIKGAASLQYGSDAIGGVINILPAHVPLSGGYFGELSLTTKTNTGWLGGSGSFSGRTGDFYFHVTATHNSYRDFLIPTTNHFILPSIGNNIETSHQEELGDHIINTAGNENAFSITSGIIKSWGNSYLETNYYESNTGFFDWQGIQNDSIRELHDKSKYDFNYPYQNIKNISLSHFTNYYIGENKLEIALGYQNNLSSEHAYLLNRTGNRTDSYNHYKGLNNLSLKLNLQTITGNIVFKINSLPKQNITLGINTQKQYHTKDGYDHILPNYKRSNIGGFISHRYNISKKWILNTGFRIDQNYFEMKESINPDPESGDSILNPKFNKKYPGTAFSVGVNFIPTQKTLIKINIGRSYRVPSAYELGAYGLHRHEIRFESGNKNNKTEKVWQFDLSIDQKWKNLSISVSPFFNYFTNYLYLNPTSYLRREGQVFEYNQSKSIIAGGESSIQYKPAKFIKFLVGTEYVYAVNTDLKKPIPFTPPFNTQTEISYLFNDFKTVNNSSLGIETLVVAKQNYVVNGELQTPGYNILNVKGKTSFIIGKQTINVMLKVKNILNQKYFNHISFYRRLYIPEPSRDIQLYITVPFKS